MELSGISSAAQRRLWFTSAQRKFTIFINTLKDQPIQKLPPDQLRGLRDLRPQVQQQQHQNPSQALEDFETYDLELSQQQYQNLSQASTQCGSTATALSNSDRVGGFSGQRVNINYFSDSRDLDSAIIGQDICASFPYSIGPGLPSHLQEPWAALIDSGAITSIAPSSFAPHVPITPHSGQLVNVNGGEIKIKGQKMVTYVTHQVVMRITFLIVEDVLNPIVGLDALQAKFGSVSLVSAVARHTFRRQFFTTTKVTTMPQALSFRDMSKGQFSGGATPNTPSSILNQQVKSLRRLTSSSTQKLD